MKIQWERSRNSDLSRCYYQNNYTKANKQPSIQRTQTMLACSLNEKQNIPSNPLGIQNVQLFSKLKQSQQQKMIGFQKMVNNADVLIKQLQLVNNNNRKSKKFMSQKDQWFKIIPVEQKQKIQKLKLMKAKIVANRCKQSGKSIQQVMRQQVIPYLDWQIHNILIGQQQKAECLDNIIEELSNIQNRKFKNLESTAEYYESPNHHNNQQTYSINIKQLQHNSSAADKISKLSTIKYLSSPQINEIFQEVQTFNRNNECTQLQKSDNEDVKIVQFTLGNLCQDQHTKHEQAEFVNPIYQIEGKILRQADKVQIGSQAAKTAKQFVDESFGMHKNIASPSQSKNNGEKSQNGELFFSRKKVPKGKVIKIRVMGHSDNDNLTAE